MRTWFYQANFCAECGNRRERRHWWQHSYFCADCAARRDKRRYWLPVVCVCGGLVLGLALSRRWNSAALDHQASPSSTPAVTVSALDTAVTLKPAPAVKTESYTICGARTKRGTPCQHRVPPGQRCAQHQGRPSIVPAAAGQNEAKPPAKMP